jgi:hypothetical protein
MSAALSLRMPVTAISSAFEPPAWPASACSPLARSSLAGSGS